MSQVQQHASLFKTAVFRLQLHSWFFKKGSISHLNLPKMQHFFSSITDKPFLQHFSLRHLDLHFLPSSVPSSRSFHSPLPASLFSTLLLHARQWEPWKTVAHCAPTWRTVRTYSVPKWNSFSPKQKPVACQKIRLRPEALCVKTLFIKLTFLQNCKPPVELFIFILYYSNVRSWGLHKQWFNGFSHKLWISSELNITWAKILLYGL